MSECLFGSPVWHATKSSSFDSDYSFCYSSFDATDAKNRIFFIGGQGVVSRTPQLYLWKNIDSDLNCSLSLSAHLIESI